MLDKKKEYGLLLFIKKDSDLTVDQLLESKDKKTEPILVRSRDSTSWMDLK